MNDEKKSLAAHRGEVIGYVRRAPFYTRDAWQGCTKAEHDFINANGYWTNPKDGFNWPSITRPIYGDHPPQAQAGAGDALPPGHRWIDPEIDMLTSEESAKLPR